MSNGYLLWDNWFGGDRNRVKKAVIGSVLVRDYNDALTDLSSWTPFDPTTGNLSSSLAMTNGVTTDGWRDVGYLSEAGASFTPKYQTTDTMVWQTKTAVRTDVDTDEEEFLIQCAESTPLVDALYYNLPLANLQDAGAEGYQITKPSFPPPQYRQILVLGIDGASGNNEYFGILYPCCLMVKPDKQDFGGKTEILTSMTFNSYPDPYSGFAVRRFREGPLWRAAGGTTAVPGTPVASVPVLAPTLTLGTASTGGTFAAGTYYWVITSTTADGESQASTEVTATLTASQEQPLNWTAVTGATGYKIYRGTTAGAENVLVTTITSGATVTYTDTGTAGTTATLPTSNTTLGVSMPAHAALLVLTPPTSNNSPWTYSVKATDTTTSTSTVVASANVTVAASSASSVSLVVAGLTATDAYTFQVSATGSNGSISAYSLASNSVTVN